MTTLQVEVCQPVTGASVAGPTALRTGEPGLYTATYTPPDATFPVTLTWDNGAIGPTAAYSWSVPGTYTLTVTATNACGGPHTASQQVAVLAEWSYHVYLPLLER
jgi:hypothetical protein